MGSVPARERDRTDSVARQLPRASRWDRPVVVFTVIVHLQPDVCQAFPDH